MRHHLPAAAAATICGFSLLAFPAAAQTDIKARAAAFERLTACRIIDDAGRRLACYDAAAAALDQAEKAGELVVVDKGQVREAKRMSFGFDLDALNIFDRGDRPEQVEKVTLEVRSARQGEGGKWIMVMTDGQVWRQLERDQGASAPKAGSRVEIRRGISNSYLASIDGRALVRVKRDK
ncbi:MAG TPA: hypothetical protein VD929_03115 [Caulobacteraceae bacterium]|nr:hypothetical protein [Caulobacteraceae bacterium]